MTVVELRKALEQFAPNAEVLFIKEGYAVTPHNLHKEGGHVRFFLEPYQYDERESQP